MRRNNYMIATLAALLMAMATAGCNFLDVSPRGSHDSDELLSNENGFKHALTGVYLQLADANLYGENTSFYMPELLCRHWSLTTDETSTINIFSNYNFNDYRGNSLISKVWSSYYLAIAQCNDILDKLAGTDAHFSAGIKELIEAEALGLRGFLHLEILRYWGPVPSEATGSTRAIPYVKEITLDSDKLLSSSWKEVTDNILSDLNKAEKILAIHDPMNKYLLDSLNNRDYLLSPLTAWESYRQNRMNYGAVLGTKARYYSWIEPSGINTDAAAQAVEYARKVVDLTYERTGGKIFILQDKTNIPTEGYTLFRECLFAVHSQKLQTIIKDYFVSSTPKLTNDKDALNEVYELSLTFGTNDMRYTNTKMWEEKISEASGQYMHFQKYGGNAEVNDGLKDLARNQVPLMRLPEMYFILMEYLPYGEALELFKTFRVSRSMPDAADTAFTDINRMKRLESEYRKEFFGEGQMFFFYKKHAYTSFPWPGFILPNGLADYVLPRPKAQQQFEP